MERVHILKQHVLGVDRTCAKVSLSLLLINIVINLKSQSSFTESVIKFKFF